MRNYTALFALLICYFEGYGQTIINGAQMHSTPNTLMRIHSDSLVVDNQAYFLQEGTLLIDKDFHLISGKVEIDGTTRISENLVNRDSLIGLSNSSLIELTGNWTNHGVFSPGLNRTVLNGTAQTIDGSVNTSFYNLSTLGQLNDIKELQGVDVNILNELNLGDVELSTLNNTLHIVNPAVQAIVRNTGFVSSEGSGRLTRSTNSAQSYLFPVGSSNGTLRYRPLEIQATNANYLEYGARLVNHDANIDGFNRSNLSDSLCDVIPHFYHKIYGTEAANISSFYIPTEDGEWNNLAHWETNQWEQTTPTTSTAQGGYSLVSVENWNNFTSENFALAIKKPSLVLDSLIEAYMGDEILITANYTGPANPMVFWSPDEDFECPTCLESLFDVSQAGTYYVEVQASEQCILRDSIRIELLLAELLFPTGFSPNQDGVNDYFRPINENIDDYSLEIYNRWGEKIFESDKPENGWDGVYKNQNMGIGTYTYIANYTLINQEKSKEQLGNFTLIR